MRRVVTLVLFWSLGLPSLAHQVSKNSAQVPPAENPAPTEKPFVNWARKNAVPLKTVEAGNGFADTQPIGTIVGDARVVALGEATHGTREFFQLKHRMLEYLATQKGFTIFSIEANIPEAYRLNDFVLHGEGDPKQLLKGMYFWTWDTQEVLNMILWMREFNRSGKGHIEFTGFDMQFPAESIRTVSNFAAIQDSAYAPVVERTYADVLKLANPIKDAPGVQRRASDNQASLNRSLSNLMLAGRCREVLNHFEDERGIFLRDGISSNSVDWVTQNARLVFQYVQLRAGTRSRDQSMAENIKWISDRNPGAKLVVWAHNGHVAQGGIPGYEPMGSYLRKIFGKDFVNFGFAFNKGSFRAVEMGKGLREFTVAPAPEGSLDHALAVTGLPIFTLDLRELPRDGPVADWMSHPHLTRSVGAGYSVTNVSSSMWDVRAQDAFDVILFVEKTSAARGVSGTILK